MRNISLFVFLLRHMATVTPVQVPESSQKLGFINASVYAYQYVFELHNLTSQNHSKGLPRILKSGSDVYMCR